MVCGIQTKKAPRFYPRSLCVGGGFSAVSLAADGGGAGSEIRRILDRRATVAVRRLFVDDDATAVADIARITAGA